MTTSAITATTKPYIAHLYSRTGAFKSTFSILNTPSLKYSLNGGGEKITINLSQKSVAVVGDQIKLTEQGGDGSVLYTGLVENPPDYLQSGSASHSLVLSPLVVECGDTPFNNNYTAATDVAQMVRDAVAQTAHCTATTGTAPNTGITGIYNFTNTNVLAVMEECRKMAGPGYYFFVDEIGQVWFGLINTGVRPNYTVKKGADYSVRNIDTPIDTQKNYVQVFGAILANTTTKLSAIYDQTGSSTIGKRALIPPLEFPNVTDQTTLNNIATTVGSLMNQLPTSVEVDLPNFGTRINLARATGTTLRYWEPSIEPMPLQSEVGTGGYSLNYPVLSVEWIGGKQVVIVGTLALTPDELKYELERMIQRGAQSGVTSILPITPGQVVNGTSGGPSVPSTIAWAFGGWSTGIDSISQTNNAYQIVKWTPGPTNNNIARYEIRYSKNADGNYTFASVVAGTVDGGGLGYLKVINLIPNTSYTYEIRAYNTLGQVGAWSSTQTAVTGLDATAPATPTGILAATTPRGAIVTWDPNPEADLQGYNLQVSIGGGPYIDVTGGPSHTTIVTYQAPAGTPSGTSLQFQVQAVDWSGNTSAFCTPSLAVNTDAITTTDIPTNAVTADKIAANSVTAQKLEAVLLLISMIKIGSGTQHIELDAAGMRAYDSIGNLLINIPDDGSPVTINAQLIAQSLVAVGNAIFQGTGNELARGATLQLDASQTNPTQPPILSSGFDGVSLPIDASVDTDSTHYTRIGLDYDGAGGAGGATKCFWQCTSNAFNQFGVELLASNRTLNRFIVPSNDGAGQLLSIARMGSYVYCLSKDGSTGSPTNFGHTGSATSSFDFSGTNTDNQVKSGSVYTTPQAGSITSLSVYMGGHTAPVSTRLCIWSAGNTLLGTTAAFSAGTGRALHTKALSSPVACTAGQTFFIGFWRDPAGDAEWGVAATGSFFTKFAASATSGASMTACGGSYTCGDMQAYGSYTPNTTTYTVRRYAQSTLALDTTYTAVSFPITPNNPVMCDDGTNIYIVDKGPLAADTIQWNKYDATLVQVGSTINTTYTASGVAGCKVTAAAAGNFDFGAARLAIAWQPATGTGQIDTFDATGARQANEVFSQPGVAAKGLAYGDALGDGARFWSCPITGSGAVNLTKYSLWVWTTASSTYWVCYSWYDSNATGGLHETQVGPRASIVMGRRQQLTMTSPALPGAGGVDDPSHVRFYMAPNATDPGATNFKLQADQVAVTYLAQNYASGGAADPASNNFPGGGPAVIQSQLPGWSLKGDGTGAVKMQALLTEDGVTRKSAAGTWTNFSTTAAFADFGGTPPSISLTPAVTSTVIVWWSVNAHIGGAAGTNIQFRASLDGTTFGTAKGFHVPVATYGETVSGVDVFTGVTAAAHTLKMQVSTPAGAQTLIADAGGMTMFALAIP